MALGLTNTRKSNPTTSARANRHRSQQRHLPTLLVSAPINMLPRSILVAAARYPRANTSCCGVSRRRPRRHDQHAHIRLPAAAHASFSTSALATDDRDKAPGAGAKDSLLPKESHLSTRETLQRIIDLSRPEVKLIGLSAATLGLTSSVTLLLPYLSGQVIDAALLAAQNPETASFDTVPVALGLFGMTALAGGGVYVRSLLLTKAANRIVSRLRRQLFASTLTQDMMFFDLTRPGDILSRLSADAQLVQAAVTTQAVSMLRGSVMSCGAAFMLFSTSTSLAFVSLATLPPVFLAARTFGKSLRERQTKVQKLHADATAIAEEICGGIKTVKQFGSEKHEVNRYSEAVIKAHDEAIDAGRAQAAFDGTVHVAANGAVLCVLGYGGTMVLDGAITAGDLTGFLMYSLLMAGNISSLSSTYAEMMKSIAAAGRVFQIVDREPLIPPNFDASRTVLSEGSADCEGNEEEDVTNAKLIKTLKNYQLGIEFRNVSFAYPSREADSYVIGPGMSLNIEPGEVIAIVGGSGSGKSTLAALLTRLYDVSNPDGAVLIDGHDVRDLHPSVLRECIGVTAQEPQLFATTIEDNIRYGNMAASDEEVHEAARLAHVLDFTLRRDAFPEGLKTFVGTRGTQLSGGQKQRVALARTILKDPRIIILDEATSALDSASEHHVKEAIDSTMKGRTVLSIAHRLSTIQQSDRIAVLKDGVIAEVGTYAELVDRKDGAFRELMGRQLVVLDE